MFLFCKLYTKFHIPFIIDNQVSLQIIKSDEINDLKTRKKGRNQRPDRVRTSAAAANLCGSVTVEAALVVSILMLAMFSVMSVMQAVHTYSQVHQTLVSVGEEAAVQGEDLKGIGEVYAIFAARMQDRRREQSGIVGGIGGISFLGSDIDRETGTIVLNVSYSVRPPLLMMPGLRMRMKDRLSFQLWCGYMADGGDTADGQNRKTVYYVTDNATVYHTSAQCSHLLLSISSASQDDLEHLRNSSGARYKPCEKCPPGGGDGTVYVTEDGTKYHTSLGCSGLKRTIHEVTDTGGLPPCSRCGGR